MSTDEPQKTRGHKKKQRTRQALLDAGIAVFAERGARLTVQDIAAAADRSTGTFYNYFEDIEDFIDQLSMELALSMGDEVAQSGIEDPARRFALATTRAFIKAEAEPAWGLAMLRLAGNPDPKLELLRHLRADLIQGFSKGRFTAAPDEMTLALVVGGLLMTIRFLSTEVATPRLPERAVARLLAVLGVSQKEAQALAAEALLLASPPME